MKYQRKTFEVEAVQYDGTPHPLVRTIDDLPASLLRMNGTYAYVDGMSCPLPLIRASCCPCRPPRPSRGGDVSRISDILDAEAYKSDCGTCRKPVWCFAPRFPGAPSEEFPAAQPEIRHYNANGSRHEHAPKVAP